jgi:hypothetical protein
MAYTLTYSLGTITVVDTTINTSTSLSLPGRNFSGYGAAVDQNQLSLLENFASYTSGPVNPIPGQTWYNNANTTLNVNVSANATPIWQTLTVSGSNANITYGNLTVTGLGTFGNLIVTGLGTFGNLSVTGTGTFGNLSVLGNLTVLNTETVANLSVTSRLTTRVITTGANTTTGNLTGTWTLTAGSSLNATYADLGERFEADAEYETGTVVELGGSKEITAVVDDASDNVFGVISSSMGYLMNSAAGPQTTHPAIAMTGRVPVKVRGQVRKGNRLVSAGGGYARAAKVGEATSFNTVGRSLEDKLTDDDGKILAAVSVKL